MERLGMKEKEMETENHPVAAALVVVEGGEAALLKAQEQEIVIIEGRSEEIEIVVVTIAATFVDPTSSLFMHGDWQSCHFSCTCVVR